MFRRPAGPIEEWQPRLYAILIALVLIVAWLITFLPAMAMWAVAGVSAQGRQAMLGVGAGAVWITALIQACSAILSAVTWPFLIIVTTLLYFDRRARTEAPDLEEAAARLQQQTL